MIKKRYKFASVASERKRIKTEIKVRLRRSRIGASTIKKAFRENTDLGKDLVETWKRMKLSVI